MNPIDTRIADRDAQYRGPESRQAEANYTNEMAKQTRNIVVTAQTQSDYDAWDWGKNKDIEYSSEELEVVDLSLLLGSF